MLAYQVEKGPSGDARIHLPIMNKVYTPQ
jgi:hypothetical protein